MAVFLNSLKIKHKDGSIEDVQGSVVRLESGVGMSVTADPAANSVRLSSGADEGVSDPEYTAKLDAVLNGGAGTAGGQPYVFYGPVRYEASWTADYGAKTLTVSGSQYVHRSPVVAPGDRVMVSEITATPACSTDRLYEVVSGNELSFVLDVPDMPSAGDASGALSWVLIGDAGAPYYVSGLGGSRPNEDGGFFLNVKQCLHWGLFEDGEHPYSNPAPEQGSLEITDVCPPCVDCGSYEGLYDYLEALRQALDDKKNRIYQHTSYVPGSYEQNNILELVKQTLLYWNAVTQTTAWRVHSSADGNEINAAMMFTNHFDAAVPAGLELKGLFFDIPAYGNPISVIIDKVVPGGWVQGVDYTTSVEPAQLWELSGDWTADYGAKTLEVVTSSPTPPVTAPNLQPGDYIHIEGSPDLPCPSGDYAVLSGDWSDFVLDVPAMNPSGSTTGQTIWYMVPRFMITTLVPLEIGESIRLYIGSVVPGYVGDAATVSTAFLNNLADLGYTSFPGNRVMKTNNMVSVSA